MINSALSVAYTRQNFSNFYQKAGFVLIPPDPLINDEEFPHTFLPSIGALRIQRLLQAENSVFAIIQDCFREWDLENVGDGKHLAFFEIGCTLGRGIASSQAIISNFYSFLINDIVMEREKLWATYFDGGSILNDYIPRDEFGYELMKKFGIEKNHLIGYHNRDTFSGISQNEEEVGYRLEIFYDRGKDFSCNNSMCLPLHRKKCNRFIEIGTIFLISFRKHKENLNFVPLPQEDWVIISACGLERIVFAKNSLPTIYDIDILSLIKKELTKTVNRLDKKNIFILSEYIRGFVFLIADGARTGGRGRKNVMRRFVRRILTAMENLKVADVSLLSPAFEVVLSYYRNSYKEMRQNKQEIMHSCNEVLLKEKALRDRR